MSYDYIPAPADWGINDFIGNATYRPDFSEGTEELDEVGSWLSLHQASASTGIAPQQFQQLAEQGLADVKADRAGRLRISLEEARRIRRDGRDPRRREVDYG
jgi:hypothetical protein